MHRFAAVLALIGVAVTVSACIVEERPPGPGPGYDRWCYYHPGRCR